MTDQRGRGKTREGRKNGGKGGWSGNGRFQTLADTRHEMKEKGGNQWRRNTRVRPTGTLIGEV